jgi:hypothetical protein
MSLCGNVHASGTQLDESSRRALAAGARVVEFSWGVLAAGARAMESSGGSMRCAGGRAMDSSGVRVIPMFPSSGPVGTA